MSLTKANIPIKYIEVQDSTRWTIAYVDITRAPYHFYKLMDGDSFIQFDVPTFNTIKIALDENQISDSQIFVWQAFTFYLDTIEQSDILQFSSTSVRQDTIETSEYNVFNTNKLTFDEHNQEDATNLIFDANRTFLDEHGQNDFSIFNISPYYIDITEQSDINTKKDDVTIYNFKYQDYLDSDYLEWLGSGTNDLSLIYNNTIGKLYEYGTIDNYYLNPNLNKSEAVNVPDNFSLNFSANRIFVDESITEDTTSLKFDAIRSFSHTVSSTDITYFNINPVYSDSYNQSDSINTTFNSNRSFTEESATEDTSTIKFDAIRSHQEEYTQTDYNYLIINNKSIDTVNQSDTINNIRTIHAITNLSFQDYLQGDYLEWLGTGTNDVTIIYNNDPTKLYNYSVQDSVVIRLNGNIVS